ncbi:unnamed protein product [Rhizoctonia solani]|uniref:DUF6533 domain-containing protein n=1 Tax=Rhizoctonia solani TaxID=456999 RepID=A0A8H3BKW9_9AGAM|nr:unnamed protein product [Rhizoctonia solani]
MDTDLEVLAHDTFVGRCVSIAALALLFYDHLITFADEVHLIWPAKFGLVKGIFFFNRYVASIWIAVAFTGMCFFLTYINLPSQSYQLPLDSDHFFRPRCRGWLTANVYFEMVNIQMLNFIIATRVYDIWQSQRLAFFILAPFWVAHFVLDLFIITNNVVRGSAHYSYSQLGNLCVAEARGLWTLWLNGIIYHALILLLLMWIWFSTPRTEQTPFVRLVLRDGFIYFITILSVMLFNLLIWRYARTSLVLLPYNIVWVILNGALSRTLLSLGSVQTSEEWGQRANLTLLPKDIELERVLSGGTSSTYTIKDGRGEVVKSCTVEVI